MLEWLGEAEEAVRIENAVCKVLEEGKIRTPDIGGVSSTSDVGDAIASQVARNES
jgi:isocitrate/isopropylmalate dehydrogenase